MGAYEKNWSSDFRMAMTTASFNTLRNLVYPIQPLITQTESSALVSPSAIFWVVGQIINSWGDFPRF